MKQEEFYSFLAMFDVEIAEKYKRDTEVKMKTDFDKLMDILEIEEESRESIFDGVINGDFELVLFYESDGSISWGIL